MPDEMLTSVSLRSQDMSSNRDRLYTMSKTEGILGTVLVVVRNARYGKQGKQRLYIFDTENDATNFIQNKVIEKIKRSYVELKQCHL